MGGAERVVLTLASEFVRLGHSVDLIIIDEIIQIDVPDTIKIHQLRFKKAFFDYAFFSKKLHIMVDKIEGEYLSGLDLILVNLQKSTRLMKNYKHKNIFHIVHNTISRTSLKDRKGLRLYLKKRSLQKIYKNLNLITVSKGVANDLLEVVGIVPASIRNIYNPVNIEDLIEKANKPLSLKIDDYIIHVGRFDIQKRHDRLLETFAHSGLAKHLVLVGDGDLKEEITKNIAELGLKDKVIMVGLLSNPYPLILNAKALILSSDYEGLSMAIIEALVLGTPVVSTDCPSGPSEILTGELSQYLVPLCNDAALGKAMKEVSENPYLIPMDIVEKFDSKNIVQKYLSLIEPD